MGKISAVTMLSAAALAATVAVTGGPALGDWAPDRPITIIVPWGAGGSTDQMVRATVPALEDALGASVVVVNQPGASGSIGTRSALEADDEGYTWTAGAAKDLGTYPVTGLLETRITDWNLYLTVANVAVVGVNADTPYETLDDLLAAMEEATGEVTVATAGVNSSGGAAIGALAAATGVEYRHVTYDGGNPAVIATASGETQVTTQLAAEQAEMIQAGRIRPLAVLSDAPLDLQGYGEIPPVTDSLPDYPVAVNYFGIFVPGTAPAEVVAQLDQVWADAITQDQGLQDYAAGRGAVFTPYWGEDAQARVLPAIQEMAWGLFDRNETEVDPESVGIPRR